MMSRASQPGFSLLDGDYVSYSSTSITTDGSMFLITSQPLPAFIKHEATVLMSRPGFAAPSHQLPADVDVVISELQAAVVVDQT